MITETQISALLGAGVLTYPCSHGRMGYYAADAGKSAYETLGKMLADGGAKLVFERTVGNTDFALYSENGRFVRLSYLKEKNAVRVLTTEEETLFEGMGDLTADGKPELWLMNMDYSIQWAKDNGEGLIIKLADGSFIVYDGGYPTEMPPLLAYLEANTPAGQKPVIATWFLTHSHGDHYWGFDELLKSEDLKRLDIRCVMAGLTTREQFAENGAPEPFLNSVLAPRLKELGIPLVRPFAGQVLHYPGVDMEILMTVEDLMPVRPWDDNTASSVTFLKFKAADRTVLVPGDSSGGALDMLTDMYGSYLKCDVLQIPHHGCSGATKTFFDCSDPEVAVFCTAEDKYLERISTDSAWNCYLMNHLHVKRAYCADHAYQQIV